MCLPELRGFASMPESTANELHWWATVRVVWSLVRTTVSRPALRSLVLKNLCNFV
jgi:hypothetical protein